MKKFKAIVRGRKDGKAVQDNILSDTTELHDNPVAPGISPTPATATFPEAFPEGIKELHTCDDAVVDICFVHGLTGNRERTWTATGQDAPWPQLLLPRRLRQARILTWGYDAYVVRSGVAGSNRLIDHSTNLVNDLTTNRAEHNASSRSLIFVAHSLGGLVCKMAIMTSKDNPAPHLKAIFRHVKGILFMGTPHTGSWMADWIKIPAWGLGVVKSSNRSLLSILQTEDQLLESLQISFLSMVRDLRDNYNRRIEVTCFYEELPMPVVGEVVSKASATFSDHPLMSIHANHSDMVKFASIEDNGFKRLTGELVRWESELSIHANTYKSKPQQRFNVNDSVRNVHWNVMRSVNNLFVGRESVLATIEQALQRTIRDLNNAGPQRFVITGMGGQGKSEICLQLAHRVRQLFWGLFWVDVSSEALAVSGFLDIANRLQIPAQTLDEARQGLANVHEPWLLILDNADDPHVDYQRFLPTGSSGVVILTSRNHECHQYATEKHITLDRLSDDEARELLLRVACVPLDQQQTLEDDAQVVASLLQSHPLALIQAGSFVSRGHCTLAQYPQVFAQQRMRVLAFGPTQAQSRYQDVYATFEASANALQSSRTESAVDALQLLPVLAICGPSRLPIPLFEAGWKGAHSVAFGNADNDKVTKLTPWHISRLLPLMQADSTAWDSFRLIEAISLLKASSLVSTDTHSGFLSVSMHPLTHAWARDRQEKPEQYESWVTTGCLVAFSRYNQVLWWQHGHQLQPHLLALLSWQRSKIFTSKPSVEFSYISMNCGYLLEQELNFSQQRLARVYLVHGQFKEAVALLEEAIKVREQILANDHPYRLASQYALAAAYRAIGKVKEAVSLLEQIVKIHGQTLAEDHPDRLASQHTLAGAYQANGQIKEAVSLLEQVIKIKEQTLAESHPSRLASQHALAVAYQAKGQVKEAVSLLEQLIKIKGQGLAENHPSRLASQIALAGAYQANGQVKEALVLLEQVVKIKEQTLLEVNPSRLLSQQPLVGVHKAYGQIKEVVSLLEQVVKIKEETLAEDHPSRTASQHALADAYQAKRKIKEAVSLVEQMLEQAKERVKEQTLAEDHPS